MPQLTQDQLRAKIKESILLVSLTTKIVAHDGEQEPIDPEMVGFWEFCLQNQYALELYRARLNADGK